MSKNNKIDVLGEAHLPADLTKPTSGSNYGLDGDPGLDYNSGLMDQFFDETMLADLPDGVTARDPGTMSDHEFFEDDGYGGLEDDDYLLESGDEADAAWFADDEGVESGMHLGDWMKDGGIQDLDWLDVDEQDADRLPKNPVNLAIPELEEAWGTERRTDGFSLQADNQPADELAYWESLQRGEDGGDFAPSYHYSNEDLGRVIRKAARRSAAGWQMKDILVEAAESLGDEAHRIKDAMEQVKAYHGLTGNVFIQAAAYPGLYRGKDWKKSLKKARNAQYIIVDKKTLEGSTLIHNGRCTITQKKAVLEVPWDEAYTLYKAHLEGAGRKVASGDPRRALRHAFLSTPKSLAQPSSTRPRHVTPSERVSSEEAQRQLATVPTNRQVLGQAHVLKAQKKVVLETLTRWVRAGHLTRDQASKIVCSKAGPQTMLRVAKKIAMAPKQATPYSGTTNDRRIAPENDPRALKAALAKSEADKVAMQARIDEMARNKRASSTRAAKKIEAAQALVAKIKAAIDRGVCGAPLRDLIRRTIPQSQMKLAGKYLVPLLQRTGAHKDAPKTAREYNGPTMRPHQARTASVAPTPRKKEAATAIQFCKEAMNQGVAGRQLDRLLKSRFSEGVLKSAKKRLKAVRSEHEGGAGFIYIDAGTYASRSGTSGCEVGGQQHRANRLHFVMAMDRCGGCALASRKSDGSSICRVYNKELVAAEEMPEELPHLRQANIAGAATSSEERTASMFAPEYDPNEFDLGANSPLNDIDFHREAGDEDEVQFTFGGIEF